MDFNLPCGMTKTPLGWPLMADAFFGCASHAITEKNMVSAFETETGYEISALANRSGFDSMIDKATGHEQQLLSAWLDWIASRVWGLEGE